MNKVLPFLLGVTLLFSATACTTAKTSSDAPNSTNDNTTTTDNNNEELNAEDAQENQEDATSKVRQDQIASDTRARQQRNDAAGNPEEIADSDVESLVRNQLETKLPKSELAVDSEEGVVTISGTVASQKELDQIESLAKEVKGVKSVNVKATVATPKP